MGVRDAWRRCDGLRSEGLNHAGAIAERGCGDSKAMKESEPHIAEGGFGILHDHVLSEADARTAACQNGRTVVEHMAGSNICAEGEADVIEEGGAIGLT